MPTYLFRCDACGGELNESYPFTTDTFAIKRSHADVDGSTCNGEVKRVVCSARFKRGLEGGFFSSVGTYATNRSDLQSQLSRKSDEVSERLGIAHNFKVADDPSPEFFGVTEEGLDATKRRKVKEGGREPQKWY